MYIVKKTERIAGEITVPPSKSHTLRAILFASLAHGTSKVHNYLCSSDTQSMIDACRLLGAKVDCIPNALQITGINGQIDGAEDVLDAGNSGIVLRFCSALGALSSKPIVITGDYSIRHQRPMKALLNGLRNLGVSAVSARGDEYAPVIIQGPILSNKTSLLGEDSQPVSALLIALAFAKQPIEIEVYNPGEKPWIDLTLSWLDRLQIPYKNDAYTKYTLFGNAHIDSFDYTVPSDWSSAAFPIAAALITQSAVFIRNIDIEDSQGDKELIRVLQQMGAQIEIDSTNKTLYVSKTHELRSITVDINNFIDSITILAVLGCFSTGELHIKNASVARTKECDRIHSICVELQKMGADITELEDGLLVKKSKLKGTSVYSYNDHRMAMSLAIAALGADGVTEISSIECVQKTFPSFAQSLKSLGAYIEVI